MTTATPQRLSPSLRRRGYLALAFNACFFAALFYWLYDNVSYAEVLAQLRRIPTSAILIAMAMNVVVLALYGWRVATILRAPPLPCFLITNIGFTFNALIPFRIGEGVKIYFGGVWFKLPVGSLSAAIVMEKFYDLSAIVALAIYIGVTSDSQIIARSRPTVLLLAGIVCVCAALIVRVRLSGATSPLLEWQIFKSLRLDAILRQAEALLAEHDAKRALLLTAMIWAIHGALVFFLFSTLLPETGFSVLSALSLLVIGALAIAVPASPAGLGVFEAGLVAYLTSVYGIENERAISAALAYHFCITAPHTMIAIVFLAFTLLRLLREKRS